MKESFFKVYLSSFYIIIHLQFILNFKQIIYVRYTGK